MPSNQSTQISIYFFARQIIPFMTMPSAVVRRDLTGSLGRGLDREKRLEREDTANWCGRR